MFVLVRLQLRNHADTAFQEVKGLCDFHICDIKFEMLQVRENEISLRKWSGGTAQLRTVEGTLLVAQTVNTVVNIGCLHRASKRFLTFS